MEYFFTFCAQLPSLSPAFPPSRDSSALLRHPLEPVLPFQESHNSHFQHSPAQPGGRFCPRRVFLYREGVFAPDGVLSTFLAPEGVLIPGGRFRPRRAILCAPTSSSRHNTNLSTLPRHFHPPLFFHADGATSPEQSRARQASPDPLTQKKMVD